MQKGLGSSLGMAVLLLPPCLVFLLLQLFFAPSYGATAEYAEYTCNGTTGNFTSGSAFAANLDRLVAELPGNASASPSLFASASAPGSADADTAYA